MIRILIVEDRQEVRVGLQMRLSAEPDIDVVGIACDGREALESAAQVAPDVILMDIEMPQLDGIETAAQLAQQPQSAPVIILTIHDDSVTRARARQACVAGFVSKEKPVEVLLAAIREIAGSEVARRCAGLPTSSRPAEIQ